MMKVCRDAVLPKLLKELILFYTELLDIQNEKKNLKILELTYFVATSTLIFRLWPKGQYLQCPLCQLTLQCIGEKKSFKKKKKLQKKTTTYKLNIVDYCLNSDNIYIFRKTWQKSLVCIIMVFHNTSLRNDAKNLP